MSMRAVIISFFFSLSIAHDYFEQCSNVFMSYGVGSTYIEFEDVVIPANHLLGRESQGFQIIMSST